MAELSYTTVVVLFEEASQYIGGRSIISVEVELFCLFHARY